MRILIAILATAALASCSSGPHRTNASLPTVSYSYDDEDEFNGAARKAEDYCADRYGRHARLVDPGQGTGEAIFECAGD
jgi:hypothetical protein